MMPSQRVRGGESRIRNKLSNGPLRVQGKVRWKINLVFCNVGHTLVAGDMLVS